MSETETITVILEPADPAAGILNPTVLVDATLPQVFLNDDEVFVGLNPDTSAPCGVCSADLSANLTILDTYDDEGDQFANCLCRHCGAEVLIVVEGGGY